MLSLPAYNFYHYVRKYDFSQLYNTDFLEKHVNYFFYKFLNISLEPNKVIAGKDGFLFLGNYYSQSLDKYRGIYRLPQNTINLYGQKLKEIQNYYESKGIKFLVVIAPNKSSIYSEKLPQWMGDKKINITDDIVSTLELNKINALDLREILISHKNSAHLLYNRTGSHWNKIGAAIGFEYTIDTLNRIYGNYIVKPQYSFLDNKTDSDSMWLFLKIKSLLKNENFDNEYTFSFPPGLNQNMCHGNINLETLEIDKCNNILNPNIVVNQNPQYTFNDNALNSETVLFICDSFATANSQIFNLTFKYLYKFHYVHLNGSKLNDFVTLIKPNIVIYQIVERDLFNPMIVENLISDDIYPNELLPENINDQNWQNGISKFSENSFVLLSRKNLTKWPLIGTKLQFQSGLRKVTQIKRDNTYINITVDGTKLDPIIDGYPNKIKVVENR